MNKKCYQCGEEIHPMRLEVLPKTKTCVQCSQEGRKVGKIVSHGVGEEVSTTLEILDSETYKKVAIQESGAIFHTASEDLYTDPEDETNYFISFNNTSEN